MKKIIKLFLLFILFLQGADIVSSSLIASYSFENKLIDSTGAHNATSNKEEFTEGKTGKAIKMDGDNDYISLGDDFLQDADKMTIALWIYPEESQTSYQIIFWEGTKESNGFGPKDEVHLSVDYKIKEVHFWMKGEYEDLMLRGNISKERWYHVAVTLKDLDTNEPSGRMYIDGNFTDINELENDVSRNYTTYMHVGNTGGKGHPYLGKIDELRIYDDFLTESQIKALFEEGIVCRSEQDCDQSETINYCWGNFFCTNTTTPLCFNPGKDSRCETEQKTFCTPCEYGCEDSKCIIRELKNETSNETKIKPEIKADSNYSFFRKLKCRFFNPLNSAQYTGCLQA